MDNHEKNVKIQFDNLFMLHIFIVLLICAMHCSKRLRVLMNKRNSSLPTPHCEIYTIVKLLSPGLFFPPSVMQYKVLHESIIVILGASRENRRRELAFYSAPTGFLCCGLKDTEIESIYSCWGSLWGKKCWGDGSYLRLDEIC